MRLPIGLLITLLSALAGSMSHASSSWPRTLQTVQGPFTLQQPPQRIVSTSVTLSGTLLAINAPLTGSGATSRNSSVSDAQGFFTQWSSVAAARQVKPLYISQPDAEAIAAEAPDLIVMSATGGDSALKLYDQLSAIAPVLVIDYGDKSWQALATQLGAMTGHEADAQQLIARFDQRVASLRQRIRLPPQPTSAVVYYENGLGMNLWTPSSAQGALLQALGFTLAAPPATFKGSTSMGRRNDIIQLSGEDMADGITGNSLLLFAANESTVPQVANNPFLAHLPAVQQQRIYALGNDTFRLDYYSASHMLNSIERQFVR